MADDYIAWCCYTHDGNEISTCDSDAKGAFKVYRHPSHIDIAELKRELAYYKEKLIDTQVAYNDVRARLELCNERNP